MIELNFPQSLAIAAVIVFFVLLFVTGTMAAVTAAANTELILKKLAEGEGPSE